MIVCLLIVSLEGVVSVCSRGVFLHYQLFFYLVSPLVILFFFF